MHVLASRLPAALPARGKNHRAGRHEPVMTHHDVVPAVPGVTAARRGPNSDVEAWRLRRLVEAGFPWALGLELATTPGIDLHAVLALVDRGCSPELAARILAPLDPGMGT